MSNEEIVTLFLDIAAGRMSRDDIEILFSWYIALFNIIYLFKFR
ncbi:hypothetical protein NIES4071_72580 [Calothrix sp. NIES-4071]|nr:hypothetical protein NIES4071_72580 [Calothrix sp. NIES-4071]BAZ61533.1 hypothetical protein NIES4105_72530 [Calothrix sp. NIES-4105]